MDLRIVNTCNNDCSYCLEQSLREKEKFFLKKYIFSLLKKENDREVLNFFWGNPLLHPDLLEIIKFAKKNWFKNIGLLSNSFWINKSFLLKLKEEWLNNFWIYFNSFSEKNHNLIIWNNWIDINSLFNNIILLKNNNFLVKIIIHINNQNIRTIYKDILILNKKYNITNFEFINYFPFDRPYNKFQKLLEYNIIENKQNIINFFKIINVLQINVKFVKFSKDFFWNYIKYYNFKKWILEQIWEEDIDILKWNKRPFCLIDKRCISCFLKDKCKWYGI